MCDLSAARLRRFIAGGLALALVVLAHFHGHVAYFGALNTDTVPVVRRDAPPAAAPHPAPRLWVILIDGLGYDAAKDLPALRALAARGIERVLMADFPSFTEPALVTIATGVPPRSSGMRINGEARFPTWDSVSHHAAAAGMRVRIADASFEPFSARLLADAGFDVARREDAFRDPAVRELTWIYFGDVDVAGHRHGGRSEEYASAARAADALVAEAAAHLDLGRDALVVLSDHGHLPAGGHGGVEPVVLRALFVGAGGPFAQGVSLPPAAMRDVASTLAFALGIAAPASAEGAPMLDAFGLAPPRDDADARAADAAYEAAFDERARPRLYAALGCVALALAGAVLLHRRHVVRFRIGDLQPLLAYGVGSGVPYLLAGYGLTWSIPRGAPGFFLETALFGAVGSAMAAWRSDARRRVEEALAAVLASGLPYLCLAAWVGLDPRWLAGPKASYGMVLLATAQFYLCAFLGARTLWRPKRSPAP